MFLNSLEHNLSILSYKNSLHLEFVPQDQNIIDHVEWGKYGGKKHPKLS